MRLVQRSLDSQNNEKSLYFFKLNLPKVEETLTIVICIICLEREAILFGQGHNWSSHVSRIWDFTHFQFVILFWAGNLKVESVFRCLLFILL